MCSGAAWGAVVCQLGSAVLVKKCIRVGIHPIQAPTRLLGDGDVGR